jgi:hypothetical protein
MTATEIPNESQQRMQDEAHALWGDAKDVARSAAQAQQQVTAQGIGEFASVLRQAARNYGDGSTSTSRFAESVADRLEGLSSTLKGRELSALVNDIENFAREQPLIFFGGAVAAGFLALRFLKSSAPGAAPLRPTAATREPTVEEPTASLP